MLSFLKTFERSSILNKTEIKTGSIASLDSSISAELEMKIRNFYEGIFNALNKDDSSDTSSLEKRISGEKSFYIRVINAINQVIKENKGKEVIPLFDIDDTLGHNKFISSNEFETILRPTALALLDTIHKNNINIGFLTSRTANLSQLNDKLKPLIPFINKNYLFSSGGSLPNEEEQERIKENLPEDLKDKLLNADLEKINLLNKLIAKPVNAKKIFLPIDDFKYPVLFHGVALEQEEKFFI